MGVATAAKAVVLPTNDREFVTMEQLPESEVQEAVTEVVPVDQLGVLQAVSESGEVDPLVKVAGILDPVLRIAGPGLDPDTVVRIAGPGLDPDTVVRLTGLVPDTVVRIA